METLIYAWRFVVEIARRWYHGGVGDLAAGVTFWILVSLPAAGLVLLAALGTLDTVIDLGFQTEIERNVLEFVGRVFTDERGQVRSAVAELFVEDANSGLLTVSLAVTVWSISRGFAGLIRALDDIYQVEDRRSWYHDRIVAVVLGVGSLLVSVPLVMMERLVWEAVPDGIVERTLRSMVALAVLITWASTIYHIGPATRSRWRHDLPGALAAAVMWWLLSVGFGWYVRLTSGANGVTAAVGAGLLALTWLWLVAQVLLIGGTINVLYGEWRDIDRERRGWRINEKLTGEFRKMVVQERAEESADHGPPDAGPVDAGAGGGEPGAREAAPGGEPPGGPVALMTPVLAAAR
jgi:membrane protein